MGKQTKWKGRGMDIVKESKICMKEELMWKCETEERSYITKLKFGY